MESFIDIIHADITNDIERASQKVPGARSDIAKYISDPFVFDSRMDPLDSERHCAILLENGGWTTRLTPATGDQGADVVAEKEGIRMVVQCKLYSQPVGNKAVQEVFAAKTTRM